MGRFFGAWLAAGAVIALACGCGDDGGSAGPDGGGGGGRTDSGPGGGGDGSIVTPADDLPCAVAEVVARNCLACHQSPPINAAPMPLVSYDALHAPAISDPSRQVWELVGERIHHPTMPMPPATFATMSDADRAVLDAWIAASAPARAAGETCAMPDGGVGDGGGPGEGVGPEHLPCTPSHTFTAHAPGSTAPFQVPPDGGNLYMCYTFRSPWGAATQATAWAPIIDDTRVVHHWILYSTETPQTDGAVMNCNMPGDSTFLMGWAPGGTNSVMPADVGLDLPGPDDYLILQLHYWNVGGLTDADDASGVAVCTTDTPRAQEAGIVWFGTVGISIPPRSTGYTVEGTCPSFLTSSLPGPIQVLSSGPHMHQLGRAFRTEIRRGGSASDVDVLVDVPRFDFNAQQSYRHDPTIQINPGDSVVTRCTYDNPGSGTVTFGEATEDEMCFNFAMVYPAPPPERRRCVGF